MTRGDAPKVSASGLLLQSGGVFGKETLQGSKDLGKTWSLLSDKVVLTDLVMPMPTTGLFKLAHGGFSAARDLEWISREPTGEVRYDAEPGAGFLKRLWIRFLSVLPIEWLL